MSEAHSFQKMDDPYKKHSKEVVNITKMLHDAYERHALSNGWDTQILSRKEWDDVPTANKNTMLDMVAEVWPGLKQQVEKEVRAKIKQDIANIAMLTKDKQYQDIITRVSNIVSQDVVVGKRSDESVREQVLWFIKQHPGIKSNDLFLQLAPPRVGVLWESDISAALVHLMADDKITIGNEWELNVRPWKAGDACGVCGSHNTADSTVDGGWCLDCGASDSDE